RESVDRLRPVESRGDRGQPRSRGYRRPSTWSRLESRGRLRSRGWPVWRRAAADGGRVTIRTAHPQREEERMSETMTPQRFHEFEWRVVRDSASTHFRTGSFAAGVALVDAIG